MNNKPKLPEYEVTANSIINHRRREKGEVIQLPPEVAEHYLNNGLLEALGKPKKSADAKKDADADADADANADANADADASPDTTKISKTNKEKK
jgi:hypothetical protein